jgi:hypothetical protein
MNENRKLLAWAISRACIAIIFISQFPDLHCQVTRQYTVSGYVREKESGESLIGVYIYSPDRKSGTVTNNYGFYSLTLPETDSLELVFSYVGYTPELRKTGLRQNTELNVDLTSDLILGEVEITADRTEKISASEKMSNVRLQVAQVKSVPSLMGEKDVLKVLQLMPGVQKGTEGTSGLYVRGGGPDQNLIILDDAIVYNASHLFGFFSLFNGDALKSIELTKGGFPARFGGRLSSVLEINMKEGNRQEWHGEGGIGLISSRFTVEGPLKKGKSSILISGRRTYADLILRPVLKMLGEENTGYYFYDLNAKVNYDFGRKNKLYLSGYFGKDKFYLKYKSSGYNENVGFLWGNATATLRWNHLFSDRLFTNTSLVFSDYTFGIYDEYVVTSENKDFYAEYYSGIRDLTLKYDLDYIPNPRHWIKAGITGIIHRFNPHAYVQIDVPGEVTLRESDYINGTEAGIYFEDTWQPFQTLKINTGLRLSSFFAGTSTYIYPEPRLSAAWRIRDDLAIKASYASMNQYIHMLSNTGISLPTDLWVPATDRVKPQRSEQLAAGFAKDFDRHDLALSVEGYYKTMDNVIGYREGASFLNLNDPSDIDSPQWEDNVTSGRSWSYGAEVMLQKKAGRFSGWIGYTLSWTHMQFDSLNQGRSFYARYDRRHDISVTGTYKINDRISISGTWIYGTGNAVSLPLSEYPATPHTFPDLQSIYYNENSNFSPELYMTFWVTEQGQKNNYRMKPYHRLDLGIEFRKEKKWGESIWEVSVYNAYNRLNPFFYYNDYVTRDGTTYGVLKQISLFPVIPSVTWSFRF